MIRPRELSSSLQLFSARTPTLLPATHTNSYAIGGRDVLLVEPATPYEDEQRAFLEWARGLVSQGRAIVGILATHHHPDHVGGLDVVARELGTGVCLFEERTKTAIVGDMVASVGTILIAPGDGDMQLYLEQLDRLAQLDASLALPAHGEPIDDPTALFRQYIAHRLMREAKVLDAVRAAGPTGATAIDLVPTAYADTPPHIWPIAKMSLEMHLEKLVREGKVAQTADLFRVV